MSAKTRSVVKSDDNDIYPVSGHHAYSTGANYSANKTNKRLDAKLSSQIGKTSDSKSIQYYYLFSRSII